MRIKNVLAAIILLLITQSAQAFPVVCVNCANMWTQLMNNVELANHQVQAVKQTYNQIQMVKNQLDMIKRQIENAKTIPKGDWDNTINQLRDINQIARRGEGLAFNSEHLMDNISDEFKGYEFWKKEIKPKEFNQHYDDLSKFLGGTATKAMNIANTLERQKAEDNKYIAQAEHYSENAAGHMQAIQAGNQLLGQVVRQLQKIETLLATQIQLTGTMVQARNEERQLRQAQKERQQKGTMPPLKDRKLKPFSLAQF